jgi:hypothetical protein
MRQIDLKDESASQLASRFTALTLDQDKAIKNDETVKYNLLYGQMIAVVQELKKRSGDQRRALIPLLDHANAQVRLMAAIATLAVAPDAAHIALQKISDRNEYPQAADARGMIRALDQGTHIPT